LHRILRLDARTSIGDLVEALNAFRPQGLNVYSSIAALLAERQLAGELRIAPRTVVSVAEVLTTEAKERIDAVLAGAGERQACGEIETGLGAALAERGVQVPPILVESVAEIPRHPHSGKHKVIEVQGA
jgi:hypothetical protein